MEFSPNKEMFLPFFSGNKLDVSVVTIKGYCEATSEVVVNFPGAGNRKVPPEWLIKTKMQCWNLITDNEDEAKLRAKANKRCKPREIMQLRKYSGRCCSNIRTRGKKHLLEPKKEEKKKVNGPSVEVETNRELRMFADCLAGIDLAPDEDKNNENVSIPLRSPG